LAIQTHISENLSEIRLTKELFPEFSSYADVYDSHGLLRHNTILAHAIHLTAEEIALIKRRGAGISHCPTSNLNLSSGCANVGEMLDCGIKVGLGTDCSGGFCPSILSAIQHASFTSKVLTFGRPQPQESDSLSFAGKTLPVATLLYLATLGGAEVCNLEQRVGSICAGKSFDALLVNVGPNARNPGIVLGDDSSASPSTRLAVMMEKFLFCGDDRNIAKAWVAGKCIKNRYI